MARRRVISFLTRAGAAIAASSVLMALVSAPLSAFASTSGVVISQVYGGGGNSGSTYRNDFIELFNAGSAPVNISGWSVQYASTAGTTWQRTNLNSATLQPGQYYLVQEAVGTGGSVNLPTPDTTGTIAMAAGAGKVALVSDTTLLTGANPVGGASVVDFVGYGLTTNAFEGSGPTPTLSAVLSALRIGNSCTDADNNNADFATNDPATLTPPRNTATTLSPCSFDAAAPSVMDSLPEDSDADVAPTANISVTFSEPVNVAAGWYDITCTSGPRTATVSGGPQLFTLNPDTAFASLDACSVTINATQVTDQDLIDPPDEMTANHIINFMVADTASCGTSATGIHAVQGSGNSTPISGTQVTVEGVVTGDYQGSTGLDGFYVQEEDADADANPATSEGLFIFDNGFNADVAVGDVARVTGYAVEFSGQTELSSVSAVLVCGTTSQPSLTDVTLPFATANGGEPSEGMLVRMHQTLTASEVFELGRFGEVLLSAGGRLRNPTNVLPPGPDALALREFNFDLNSIILDDGSDVSNPDPTPFLFDGPTLRLGDTVDDLTGVLGYAFGKYRIQPVGPVPFVRSNPRTAGPENVGGTLKIAALNVLNFFNGNGSGGGFPTPRGANTLAEFNRQKPKTIAAIVALDPDVAGMMEMENDNTSTQYGAIEELIDGLNAATAPGTYAFIDTGVLGTDEIRVAVLYKPSKVTPVGPWATITTGPFFDKSRPPIAQAFEENATGERFIFVVNHFKSKGSCPTSASDPNADQGDLQGCWNPLRVESANMLLDWLENDDPTGTGDPDILIMGDLNAYAKEDPIAAIESRGYTNLIAEHIGEDAYSYVFDGESGYLDHAIGSASVVPHVTGVTEWHNNADEPIVLDYNVENKSSAQQALNLGTPYRASDHDPVTVGLTLGAPGVGIDPASLSFDDQLVGTTSAAQTVTVTNTGTLPLDITAVSASTEFGIDGDACTGLSLEPTESCSVGVTFTPASEGAKTGSLSIESNADSSPDSIGLSGTGIQQNIDVSPASLSFGDQFVGTTSGAQDVTITNNGTALLSVSALSASGDFAISGGTCAAAPFTLAASASCTVSVTFTPSATGARTGSLSVESDAPGGTVNVSLSGTGVQPGIDVSPASLSFGDQVVGTTSGAQDLTITNNGTALLSVSSVSVSGDFAISGGTCAAAPFTLAAGSSCTVSITFTPSATGAQTGSLSIGSDAPGGTVTIPLSGTGIVLVSNLLVNGGFEIDLDGDGVPDNWHDEGLSGPEGQTCSVAYAGLCSLRLDDRGRTSEVSQSVSVTGGAGDRFVFSIFNKANKVRNGGEFEALIVIKYNNHHSDVFKLKFKPGTYDWKANTLAFKAKKAYKQITVILLFDRKGTAWFDEASLVRVP